MTDEVRYDCTRKRKQREVYGDLLQELSKICTERKPKHECVEGAFAIEYANHEVFRVMRAARVYCQGHEEGRYGG